MLYPAGMPHHVGWSNVRPASESLTRLDPVPSSLSYTWINQERKSVHLPAPTYIDYVMTWIQNLLDDENVFPTKSGALQNFTPHPHLTCLQAMISLKHSLQQSNTYTANFSAFSHIYTMHITHKSSISVPNLISTLFSRIFLHLVASTTYLKSKISRVPVHPLSVLALYGKNGERWVCSKHKIYICKLFVQSV